MMAGHERLIPCPRRPLGSHRTAAAEGAAEAEGRPPARPGSRRPRRHRLRPADGLPLAAAARRSWAAAAARPAGGGCATGRKPASGQRLHETLLNWLGDEAAIDWCRASVDSLSVRAKRGASRPARTRSTAASPAPSTTWSSTATASRWPSASRPPTPTTRPSCSRWSTPSRRSSARAGDRAAPQAPGQAARRQGLRLLRPAPCPARSRHHPAHRPPRHRLQRAAGAAPLGGRAHALLAARLPPPRRPLRAAGRPAPGAAPPGLRPDLPALPAGVASQPRLTQYTLFHLCFNNGFYFLWFNCNYYFNTTKEQ